MSSAELLLGSPVIPSSKLLNMPDPPHVVMAPSSMRLASYAEAVNMLSSHQQRLCMYGWMASSSCLQPLMPAVQNRV